MRRSAAERHRGVRHHVSWSCVHRPPVRSPLHKSLFVQVVAALILGIILGMFAPGFAVGLKFFSDAFLKLISMIVAPIVFCVVVHGIAGARDLKKVGRVGGKALLYFEAMTTVALIVGLLLVLGISLVTSKGTHGVPGSAIVILAATLNAVPAIPAIGLVLVLSIDWFIGMARALGNLIGNCVATVVIGAWEKDLDVALAKRVLAGDVVVDIAADSSPLPLAPAQPA